MLCAQRIISAQDRDKLLAGLDAVRQELAQQRFPFRDDDEDIHMAIERRLTEIAGPVGGRLHTARSRNDQVATDVAMYTRQAAGAARAAVQRLMTVLLDRAEQHLDWPMPGLHAPPEGAARLSGPPPARLLLDALRATVRVSPSPSGSPGGCRLALGHLRA